MPKTQKKVDDSSSEDSGPGDASPPPSKKAKSGASDLRKTDEEEPTWHLENKRFLKVREFRGKIMIDIREYYELDGALKPGRKGICLSAGQWTKLQSIISEVNEEIKKH